MSAEIMGVRGWTPPGSSAPEGAASTRGYETEAARLSGAAASRSEHEIVDFHDFRLCLYRGGAPQARHAA